MAKGTVKVGGSQDKPKETARSRFVRLGNKRASKVLASVDVLAKLAAPSYEYTPEDVSKVFTAIRDRVDAAEARFMQPTTRKREPVDLLS